MQINWRSCLDAFFLLQSSQSLNGISDRVVNKIYLNFQSMYICERSITENN